MAAAVICCLCLLGFCLLATFIGGWLSGYFIGNKQIDLFCTPFYGGYLCDPLDSRLIGSFDLTILDLNRRFVNLHKGSGDFVNVTLYNDLLFVRSQLYLPVNLTLTGYIIDYSKVIIQWTIVSPLINTIDGEG